MSKKENMESQKRFMYVRPTFRSNKYLAFYLCSSSTFGKDSGFYFSYAF